MFFYDWKKDRQKEIKKIYEAELNEELKRIKQILDKALAVSAYFDGTVTVYSHYDTHGVTVELSPKDFWEKL